MDKYQIETLLRKVANREIAVTEALEALREQPYAELDFARLDHHRSLRKGISEVVFGQGKTPEQAAAIAERFMENEGKVIVTRANPEMAQAIQEKVPDATYESTARIVFAGKFPEIDMHKYVAVVTAGTSDIPVAEEAAVTLSLLGTRSERLYDVGVAGLHRLLDKREILWNADAIIAIAGMEGALASVIGGLVACPVIAVPTSIGYGASFNGLAALLAMLNSCALGVAVMNIDNGFGAAVFAHLICKGKK